MSKEEKEGESMLRIITDSASDLPTSVIEEFHAYVMPTPVTINGVDYFDGETIFPDEFYARQQAGDDIKTYHISQFMFEEHFRKFAEAKEDVLYICFSTGIAGTYNAARLAAQEIQEEYPEFSITIVDSKCGSIGYGLVTERLLTMQGNGASDEILLEAAQFFCDHMKHVFTVKSLDYLCAGGRISKVSATMGTALDIKPIIYVDENGSLATKEKVRGWNKALRRIVEIVGETGKDLDRQVVATCYGMDQKSYERIIEMIREQYHVKGILTGRVGCAIGAHTGPSIAGIVYLDEICEAYEHYL